MTRQFFYLLMFLGHAISCFVSRQMAFNADAYQVRLVGADVSEATNLAHQDLHLAWQENHLADNLPSLILANEPHVPANLLQQTLHAMQKRADRDICSIRQIVSADTIHANEILILLQRFEKQFTILQEIHLAQV